MTACFIGGMDSQGKLWTMHLPSRKRGVNRQTDRQILKIFLPGFWIQREILTNFRILQLQWIADSSTFWARILDFVCNQNIFGQISDSGRKWKGGFVYPYSPPSRKASNIKSDLALF